MKKVLFKAPMLTQSGYGVHARQIARYLLGLAEQKKIELFCEPVRWGDTTWAIDLSMYDGLVRRLQKHFKPLVVDNKRIKFDVSIQLILPNEWTPADAKYNIGITAGVESDRCSEKWVECCNQMDMIIVPSKFTENVITSSGALNKPIHVVPEAYPDTLLSNDIQPVDFGFETDFNFLIVSQLTANHSGLDRKNIFSTVSCLCETFSSNKNVGVIIKTNSGRCTKIDRLSTIDKFKQMLKVTRKDKQFPKIHILHGDMSDHDMAALYRDKSVRAFVSMTRGEGYGLPILEAAVAGLPVIATDWSGHLDFMNKGKFIKIGYELQAVPEPKIDGNIWIKGARWANPSEANAKTAFKKFHQSPDIPKQWALDLSEKLKSEYSYDAIALQYDKLLSSVLL